MLFKLSNLNSNLALTQGYLNPALNNSALVAEDLLKFVCSTSYDCKQISLIVKIIL